MRITLRFRIRATVRFRKMRAQLGLALRLRSQLRHVSQILLPSQFSLFLFF